MSFQSFAVAGLLGLALVGCNDEAKNAPKPAAAQPPEPPAAPSAAAVVEAPAAPTASSSAPRKPYGPKDMRLDACVTLSEEGVLRGRKCTSPFPVFGPYVDVPPNAEVEVSFKVKSPIPISVFSDVVSKLGSHFHAGLLEQQVAGNEERLVGYRVALPQGTSALEARIGVRSESPVDFDIVDLSVNVR